MAIFQVFATLVVQGYFPAGALSFPVEYERVSDNVRNVYRMLDCFTKLAD